MSPFDIDGNMSKLQWQYIEIFIIFGNYQLISCSFKNPYIKLYCLIYGYAIYFVISWLRQTDLQIKNILVHQTETISSNIKIHLIMMNFVLSSHIQTLQRVIVYMHYI